MCQLVNPHEPQIFSEADARHNGDAELFLSFSLFSCDF